MADSAVLTDLQVEPNMNLKSFKIKSKSYIEKRYIESILSSLAKIKIK